MSFENAEVCIVGGGIGGLAAAHELAKQGISSVVLEASERLGGRIKTVQVADASLEVGAVGLLGSYKTTAQLINEIGLQSKLSRGPICLGVPRDGKLHPLDMARPLSILRTELLSGASLWRARKLVGPLLRNWKNLQFETITPLQHLDDETVEAFTRRELNDELYEFLISPVIRALWQRDAEEAPLADLFWSLKAFAPTMYELQGGIGSLTDALASQANCLTQAVVEEVEDAAKGATVSFQYQGQSHSRTFRACIMAVPSTVTAKLLKPLPDMMGEALNQLPYSTSVNVHLALSKAIGGKTQIIFPPESTAPDLTTLVFDHNRGSGRTAPGKGALSLFWRDSWSRPRLEADEDSILRDAIEQTVRVLPDFDESLIEASHIERWNFAGVCRPLGAIKSVAHIEAARKQLKSVSLAGDYFALSGVNAAVISGLRAARETTNR